MKYFNTDLEDQETIINILYKELKFRIYSNRPEIIQSLTLKLGKPTKQYMKSKTYWSGCSWDIEFTDLSKVEEILNKKIFIDGKVEESIDKEKEKIALKEKQELAKNKKKLLEQEIKKEKDKIIQKEKAKNKKAQLVKREKERKEAIAKKEKAKKEIVKKQASQKEKIIKEGKIKKEQPDKIEKNKKRKANLTSTKKGSKIDETVKGKTRTKKKNLNEDFQQLSII